MCPVVHPCSAAAYTLLASRGVPDYLFEHVARERFPHVCFMCEQAHSSTLPRTDFPDIVWKEAMDSLVQSEKGEVIIER